MLVLISVTILITSLILHRLKCKYRKDDKEEYKDHSFKLESDVSQKTKTTATTTTITATIIAPEDLELCGVCGNPEVEFNEDEEDETHLIDWIKCEVCKQWFHQNCLGISLDISDFICSNECMDKDTRNSPIINLKTKSSLIKPT